MVVALPSQNDCLRVIYMSMEMQDEPLVNLISKATGLVSNRRIEPVSRIGLTKQQVVIRRDDPGERQFNNKCMEGTRLTRCFLDRLSCPLLNLALRSLASKKTGRLYKLTRSDVPSHSRFK